MQTCKKSGAHYRASSRSSNRKQHGWVYLGGMVFAALHSLVDFPLLGQQQNWPITVNVNAVNLLATVRDKHDSLISNLTKEDFLLEQDGKPQTITYFAKESDLALMLGLLVDTSVSQRRVLAINTALVTRRTNPTVRSGITRYISP